MVRGRRRLSPPAWVAAPSLRLGYLLRYSMGYYWEPGRGYYGEAKVKNTKRETRDPTGRVDRNWNKSSGKAP